MQTTDHHDRLRNWAKGMYPCEAATELLIRTRWAEPGQPWVEPDGWIDFNKIIPNTGAYSGGERRLLAIAASIAGAEPVDLDDAISGIDRRTLDLVLAAIAHAAGSHEHGGFSYDGDGRPNGTIRHESLYPWPPADDTAG